ncbi:abl interactor 2-like isoform X1 [Centruroides sculpturatus]|uniref:abl interactor 2-like isoform X1 n=1 Tax=Centruroides sculpturatus TaxID=218467 RepID=UPI000C6D2862|nr:abl interactor 2-like isoform X1 [Centruroides sculpturatus]
MADLVSLMENEIPEGLQSLQDSHTNLEKVAEYCEANYYQADNKRAALEETKNYTTQSLASVAYQINTLAYNVLHMLDLQTTQLAEMESQINHIGQTVMIHKEKVARREIGILTTNKNTSRQHKILAPANPERPIKYIRKPIDYTVLDDIGHGVKMISNTPRSKRTLGPGSQSHINGGSAGPAPTTKPPTPPQPVRAGGSLSRGSKEYRTPAPPIAPPQVPSNYAPNYPIGHPRSQESRRGSGYSTLPIVASHSQNIQQSQPQIGMVHPITHHQQHTMTINPPSPIPPPPPPEMSSVNLTDSLPEPPIHLSGNDFEHSGNVSPPLPPPPPEDEGMYNYNPLSSPNFLRNRSEEDPSWVPKNYLDKVVAIYDYAADKEDELSFSENSVIYVIKKNDDGWYEGVMDGVTGLFPGNYVEPCL